MRLSLPSNINIPFRDMYADTPAMRRIVYMMLFVFSLLMVWQVSDWLKKQSIDTLQQESNEQLEQLSGVIEQTLATYQHIPTLLASNNQVLQVLRQHNQAGNQADEAENIHQLNITLEQINSITESSDSYIIATNGVTLAASNHNTNTDFIGKNFAYRPYFKQAMLGQPGRYYALGSTTNRRGYYFSYPVIDNSEILGVAVVKIDLRQLEARLENQKYDFLMLDPDGVIFSSSKPNWIYKTLHTLTEDERQVINDSQRYMGKRLERLAFTSQEQYDENARIIQLLEETDFGHTDVDDLEKIAKIENSKKTFEAGKRVSYLHISKPIDDLELRVDLFVSLAEIETDVVLWRTLIITCLMIAVLLLFSAKLRKRMLNERHKAEEMKRQNQAYIHEIVNNTQAGLVTLDANKNIESYNPAVEQLVGCSLVSIINQPLDVLFTAIENSTTLQPKLLSEQPYSIDNKSTYDSVNSKASFKENSNSKESTSALVVTACEGYLHFNSQNEVAVEMTLCRMMLPNDLKYLVTFHDMTERKRYEHEIILAQTALEQRVSERTFELEQANQRLRDEIRLHKDTQQELIQTAKLAVLGQLSAGINHELNQPLTAMRAFAENALKFIQRDNIKLTAQNLQQIVQLSGHMRDIIARFKVFARKGNLKHSPVSLDTAVKGALSIMLSRLKEADISFIIPRLGQHMVMGDLVLIEQVLVNLIANAIDAIEASGNKRKCIAIILDLNQPDWTRLILADSGNGLNEDDLDNLFEPFYSSKGSDLGLGLGLSISQRIVESMGGTIQAYNTVQDTSNKLTYSLGGAAFSISLKSFSHLGSSQIGLNQAVASKVSSQTMLEGN